MPDYRDDFNDWRRYISNNTEAIQGYTAATPTAVSTVPAVATPAPSGSGLSALYSRSNPYGGKGEMLASRAFRDTGNQRDYAAPVLAYLAGKKMKQAEQFTEKRNKDVDAYISRMEMSDQVRANKELLAEQEKLFNKVGVPAIQKTYITEYRRAKDQGWDVNKAQEAASKAASTFANEWANKYGMVGLPFIEDMVLFQGGTAFRGREYDAKRKTFSNIATYKTIPSGQVMKDDGRGNWIPAENVFSLGEVLQHEQAEAAKAKTKALSSYNGLSGGSRKTAAFYDAQGRLAGYFGSPEEAYVHGGVATKEQGTDPRTGQTTYSFVPTSYAANRELSENTEKNQAAFNTTYGKDLTNIGKNTSWSGLSHLSEDKQAKAEELSRVVAWVQNPKNKNNPKRKEVIARLKSGNYGDYSAYINTLK